MIVIKECCIDMFGMFFKTYLWADNEDFFITKFFITIIIYNYDAPNFSTF